MVFNFHEIEWERLVGKPAAYLPRPSNVVGRFFFSKKKKNCPQTTTHFKSSKCILRLLHVCVLILLYVCRFGVDSSRVQVQELDVNVGFGGEGVHTRLN